MKTEMPGSDKDLIESLLRNNELRRKRVDVLFGEITRVNQIIDADSTKIANLLRGLGIKNE